MLFPNATPHPTVNGFVADSWDDANDLDRLTLVGDQISVSGNKAIAFNDFSQAADLLQPEYQPLGINGKGVIEKVDSPSLERLSSLNLIAPSTPNFFLQFAWRYTGTLTGTNGYLFSIVFNASGTVQYLLTINTVTKQIFSRPWRQFTGTVGGVTSSLVLNQDQPYIIEIMYDQANSLHSLTIDGVFQGSSSTMLPNVIDRFEMITNHWTTLTAPQSQRGTLFGNRAVPSYLRIKNNRRYLANRYNISI